MKAYTLVASWAMDRALEMETQADKVDAAYTKEPMKEACGMYAESLRRAAASMRLDARYFLDIQSARDINTPAENGSADT